MYLRSLLFLVAVVACTRSHARLLDRPTQSPIEKLKIVEAVLRDRHVLIGDSVRVVARGLYLVSGRNPEYLHLLDAQTRSLVVGDTAEPAPMPERQAYALRRWRVVSVTGVSDGSATLEARVTYGREHFETFLVQRTRAGWRIREMRIHDFVYY